MVFTRSSASVTAPEPAATARKPGMIQRTPPAPTRLRASTKTLPKEQQQLRQKRARDILNFLDAEEEQHFLENSSNIAASTKKGAMKKNTRPPEKVAAKLVLAIDPDLAWTKRAALPADASPAGGKAGAGPGWPPSWRLDDITRFKQWANRCLPGWVQEGWPWEVPESPAATPSSADQEQEPPCAPPESPTRPEEVHLLQSPPRPDHLALPDDEQPAQTHAEEPGVPENDDPSVAFIDSTPATVLGEEAADGSDNDETRESATGPLDVQASGCGTPLGRPSVIAEDGEHEDENVDLDPPSWNRVDIVHSPAQCGQLRAQAFSASRRPRAGHITDTVMDLYPLPCINNMQELITEAGKTKGQKLSTRSGQKPTCKPFGVDRQEDEEWYQFWAARQRTKWQDKMAKRREKDNIDG